MSILEKLRTRAGVLLTIVIGLAMLGFIIEGAIVSWNFGGVSNVVGVFDNTKVDYAEYQQQYKQTSDLYRLFLRNVNEDELQDEINSRVWEELISRNLYSKEFEKIGLTVPLEELVDLVQGDNISPIISNNPSFLHPTTRAFNAEVYKQQLKSIRSAEAASDTLSSSAQEQLYIQRSYLHFLEKQALQYRLYEKYTNMVQSSRYISLLEAQRNAALNDEITDVDFVKKEYSSIPDSLIIITPKDFETYYNSHKEMFKVSESHKSIEYVVFSVTPSVSDIAASRTSLEKLLPELSTTTTPILFAQQNSDARANTKYIRKSDIARLYPDLETFVAKAKKGDVSDIYETENTFRAARVADIRALSDSIEIRRIVLTPRKRAIETQQFADSLINAYKRGTPFDTLLIKYSQNEKLTVDGGNVGWNHLDNVPQIIIDSCFLHKDDKLRYIKLEGTVMLLQVIARSPEQERVQIAEIIKNISISESTRMNIHTKANELVINSKAKEETFRQLVTEMNYSLIPASYIRLNDRSIGSLGQSRELVRWVYQNDKGSVSPLISLDNKYVVAVITEETPRGYNSVNAASAAMTPLLMKEKKGEYIIAQWGDKKNYDDLVSSELSVNSEKGVRFNGMYFNSRVEPKVIGTVTAMEVNETTKPIIGDDAVYVCKITDKQSSPSSTDIGELRQRAVRELQQQQVMRKQQQVMSVVQRSSLGSQITMPYELERVLQDNNRIEDYRGLVVF